MRTIHKYQFSAPVLVAMLPPTAKIVHVGTQNDRPTMWVETDTTAVGVEREFAVIGTGHPITGDMTYLGTSHVDQFVWHIYERNRPA